MEHHKVEGLPPECADAFDVFYDQWTAFVDEHKEISPSIWLAFFGSLSASLILYMASGNTRDVEEFIDIYTQRLRSITIMLAEKVGANSPIQ